MAKRYDRYFLMSVPIEDAEALEVFIQTMLAVAEDDGIQIFEYEEVTSRGQNTDKRSTKE